MNAGTVDVRSRNLRLVEPSAVQGLDRPWLLVHSIRTAFLVCVLLVSVIYQVRLGSFLNTEIWLPVYSVLLFSFTLNSVYLFLFERIREHIYWNATLFAMDTAVVSLLIYFTGAAQPMFMFLFLVNLILGGLVFGKDGSWMLAIWTSICFSCLVILSPDVSGQGLYFSVTVNNLAFIAVTLLGGQLAEQLNDVGVRLQEVHSDLQALQNLNELIVNNITTGIVVMTRTGFVQFFNQPAVKILGKNEFQQMKIQDVIPSLGWPWLSLIEDESRAFERREVRISQARGEGGGHKVLEIVVARFRDAEGKLKGWLLLFDDRTDQKQLEETLLQQEKLAAVGQLAAGIAHEIRNPLASISGSIQLMLGSQHNHNEEDLKLMRIVDKEINRLNGLISEFLDYVRPEKKATSSVNLNNVIREVVEALQFNPKLRKDVEQKLKLKARSEILGNRDKLKQACLNFVINAYQAMEQTEHPVLEVETVDQGELVVMILRDNGCGIKAENVGRIFEPFHTTKPQGTGLGLAVTHKILLAHDARVFVESSEGQGTRFLVEFPAARDFYTEDLIPLKQKTND